METIKVGYCRECFSPDKAVNMNSVKIGETTDTAATCALLPICPTKNISAMLYSKTTIMDIMAGIAMRKIACQTGAS